MQRYEEKIFTELSSAFEKLLKEVLLQAAKPAVEESDEFEYRNQTVSKAKVGSFTQS